jgi:hypothetical protein
MSTISDEEHGMRWNQCRYGAVILAVGCLWGCRSTGPVTELEEREAALALLLPSEIEIVAPFTKLKSFSESDQPDGIEILLQARNALDNPGLMIAGTVRIELYSYLQASAERKGRQLQKWTIPLQTEKQQKAHWNRLTQMYEFRVGVDVARIPRADRYVLLVTYRSPFGTFLTDELVLSPRAAAAGPA